jgi:eukaryotic-like serine/threonine-protein kinase
MPLSPLRPGDPLQLGSYEVLGRLGAGGQGVVYLGQIPDGDRVAIKVLHYDVDEAFLIRELAMMRQVASFCTARVLDAQVTGNTWYIVSEYIDGRSLADVVDHDGPITGGSLERLAVGTVTALTAIHQTGVVHRDFKPANILLGPDGPRVIDFGIAKTLDMNTSAGEIRGTPAYMAPEQINGQTAGTAADMFAWAATMGYAGTGRSPFGSDTLPAIIMRVLQEQPDLHELTGTLHEMAMACLAKDPAARPTAAEVLIRLLGHAPAAPMQALREGTVLAANINLPPAAANLQPVAPPALQAPAPPSLQPSPAQPPASYPSAAGHPPPASYPSPAAGYPPTGSPSGAPWPGGDQPPVPPRRRSSALTRVVAPIAAVVIVAVGAGIGLALTGALSGAKHGSAPTTTPISSSVSPTQRIPKPTPTRRARTRAKPAPRPTTPAPVQATPAPVQTSPPPVQTSPPPTGNGPISEIPADLGGQWSGIGHQPGDAQTPTYTIVMSLSGGGTTGSTFYSSLSCHGTLTLLSGSTANSVQLREQITSGGCTTTGVFTVHLKNGQLVFSYAPGDTGPASYGTLHS